MRLRNFRAALIFTIFNSDNEELISPFFANNKPFCSAPAIERDQNYTPSIKVDTQYNYNTCSAHEAAIFRFGKISPPFFLPFPLFETVVININTVLFAEKQRLEQNNPRKLVMGQ